MVLPVVEVFLIIQGKISLVNYSSKNDTNNVDLRYLCRISDITPSKSRSFLIRNRSGRELEIAVFNVQEKYYAISNICKHVGGPLSRGNCKRKNSNMSMAWLEIFYYRW